MSTSSSAYPKPSVVTGYPVAVTSSSASAIACSYPAPPPRAASAYYHAYGAPPPYYPPQPPAYYPSDETNLTRSATSSLRCILSVLIAVVLVIGLATVILWLVLHPRAPEVSLSAAWVSGFNLSSSRISGTFDVAFSFHNTNGKMDIFYDRLTAAVIYGADTLVDTSLPPFYQGKGNTTDVRALLVVHRGYVDPNVASGIEGERGRGDGDGAVGFDFGILAWVRFRSSALRTSLHAMRVYCGDVRIGFANATASSGKLVTSSPHKCVVYL